MECAKRTDADKKGGHLAKKGMFSSDLLLRESGTLTLTLAPSP